MLKTNYMIRIANIARLLTLPVLLLVINSCKKEATYESQKLPEITSVSPVAAVIGTQITIKGKNLKDVTKVRFGTKDAAGFNASANTDSSVIATVPAGLDPGSLYVQVYYATNGYSS